MSQQAKEAAREHFRPISLARWLTGRAHVTSIYMHNFMSSEQVAGAAHDATVRARLDGCVFKGAIQREDGAWEAIPMCSMNQSEWGNLYARRLAAADQPKTPIPA